MKFDKVNPEIFKEIKGNGYAGYMLIILDPSRVFVGTALPEPADWGYGITLDAMAQQYGAVAGINAGGFYDPDGNGNGSHQTLRRISTALQGAEGNANRQNENQNFVKYESGYSLPYVSLL